MHQSPLYGQGLKVSKKLQLLVKLATDRVNIVTAEIGTPDNPTDRITRKSERSVRTFEEKLIDLSWNGHFVILTSGSQVKVKVTRSAL